MIGVLAAFAIGVLIAGQSRVNGELGHQLGDGLVAATISFGTGLVFLLLLYVTVPRVRGGLRQVRAALRPDGTGPRLRIWQCLGGVAGAYLVTTQSITVGVLGVAVFTVAVVAGQSMSSLVVDRLGLGPGGVKPITVPRVAGGLLALGAVLLAVSDELGTPGTLLLAALPALAGIGTAWQQAVNGRVGAAAIDPELPRQGISNALVAALINFVVGTVVLLLALAVDLLLRGLPEALPSNPVLYVGGLCGVAFITLSAAIVPRTGVLLLGLGSVAGQLVGAMALDLLLPSEKVELGVGTVAGTSLALVAIVVAALPWRTRSGREPAAV